MTDLLQLKETYNLLAVVPNLKPIGPRYWGGPCPFCGGSDRFQLKATQRGYIWLCRYCSPDGQSGKKYQDPVEYLARAHSLNLHSSNAKERYAALTEISRLLGGSLDGGQRQAPRPAPIPEPVSAPDWQTSAYGAMRLCEQELYEPEGERRWPGCWARNAA